MDDLETILRNLQANALAAACAIDPKFKERLEADRAELAAHEKMLEAQRLPSQQKTPPIEQQRRPQPEPEPGESEREILERVNRAVIERRDV